VLYGSSNHHKVEACSKHFRGAARCLLARPPHGPLAAQHQGLYDRYRRLSGWKSRSVRKAFDHLGHESAITDDAEAIAQADRIVLPGVEISKPPRRWSGLARGHRDSD
jgi:hypothetical protein